ncbi:MAG TPA: hypothetical protein VNN72_17525, partial [Polyangiaceae bacterium]|nr:hypothetical protein [Polyangiaceae bacterium]
MGTMHDPVSWLGAAVFALACNNAGDGGTGLGSGGAMDTAGAPAAGAAGLVHSNAGDTSGPGGAGMAFGGRAGASGGGAGAASGSGGALGPRHFQTPRRPHHLKRRHARRMP